MEATIWTDKNTCKNIHDIGDGLKKTITKLYGASM